MVESRAFPKPVIGRETSTQRRPSSVMRTVDPGVAAAMGVRKLESERLVLWTDLPESTGIDTLPQYFDLAVPQYETWFRVSPERTKDWRPVGCVMRNPDVFRTLQLLPESLPPFRDGYSVYDSFWCHEQETLWYQRNLMFHEGVHCFMVDFFGGCGAPWYMEGLAEFLAAYRLEDDGTLTLGVIPTLPAGMDRSPGWGRIRLLQELVRDGERRSLRGVMRLAPEVFDPREAYSWCWATATLLANDPESREVFRQMAGEVRNPDFTVEFLRRVGDEQWARLEAEWYVFLTDLEYGMDYARTRVGFGGKTEPVPENVWVRRTIPADRGWIPTGLWVESGEYVRFVARGRIRFSPDPIVVDGETVEKAAEPDGISIHYHRGRPLGQLVLAIASVDAPGGFDVSDWISVGSGCVVPVRRGGELFLRVNDSAADLADNDGDFEVAIRRVRR
ncbi:MAG: hypothetical protein Q4C47_03145 [Planctomycetia bacterium]|nr:hypothetical protein [Planctomycetia bacterium]